MLAEQSPRLATLILALRYKRRRSCVTQVRLGVLFGRKLRLGGIDGTFDRGLS
jgi:hypothetical protein